MLLTLSKQTVDSKGIQYENLVVAGSYSRNEMVMNTILGPFICFKMYTVNAKIARYLLPIVHFTAIATESV